MNFLSKSLSFFLISLITACANKSQTENSQFVSENAPINSIDAFLQKNELPNNTWKIINDFSIIEKIQKDGLMLNVSQKKNLLANIVKYPLNDYTAIFYTADILIENMISAIFFIQYSDLEEILLVNYSQEYEPCDYLKIWQREESDLIDQDSIYEIYYDYKSHFFVEKEQIRVITKYKEFKYKFSTDELNMTYRDSICKYFNITNNGKFNFSKIDSIVSGVKFANIPNSIGL